MTYILTTNNGGDPETFRKVTDRVDDHAHGLIARFAGMNDRGLAVTTVWESKAASDRFAAEYLMPALREIVGDLTGPPPTVVEFETFESFQREVER